MEVKLPKLYWPSRIIVSQPLINDNIIADCIWGVSGKLFRARQTFFVSQNFKTALLLFGMKIVQSLLEQLQAVKDLPKKFPQIKEALDKATGMLVYSLLRTQREIFIPYRSIPFRGSGGFSQCSSYFGTV
jgi:hypothetical protein